MWSSGIRLCPQLPQGTSTAGICRQHDDGDMLPVHDWDGEHSGATVHPLPGREGKDASCHFHTWHGPEVCLLHGIPHAPGWWNCTHRLWQIIAHNSAFPRDFRSDWILRAHIWYELVQGLPCRVHLSYQRLCTYGSNTGLSG